MTGHTLWAPATRYYLWSNEAGGWLVHFSRSDNVKTFVNDLGQASTFSAADVMRMLGHNDLDKEWFARELVAFRAQVTAEAVRNPKEAPSDVA